MRFLVLGQGSGGGGRGFGKGGFPFPGKFIELTDVPANYTGSGGKVVTVKLTEDGLEFNAESVIDRHDVKGSATDADPQFLDSKVDGKTITVESDLLNVKYGYWFQKPVKSRWDASGGLPVPSGSDRYLCKTTGSGWSAHNIYEYNGATWDIAFQFSVTNYGVIVYVEDEDIFYYHNQGSSIWQPVGWPFVFELSTYTAKILLLNTNGLVKTSNLDGTLSVIATITAINSLLTDGSLLTSKAAEISALTNKAVPTTSDLLLIEDAADSNKKKKITIANLPAAAPAAHALAGALHSADTKANLDGKVSDADLISTLGGEISALTAKTIPTTSDLLLIEDAAAANAKKKINVPDLYAHGFLYPNSATGTITTYATSTGGANLLYYRGLYWSAQNQVAAWQMLIPTPYNPASAGELILRFILKGINLGGSNRTYTFGLGAMAIPNNADLSGYSMVYADTFSFPVLVAEEQNWFLVERTITIANTPTAGKALIIQLKRTDAVTGQPECMGVWYRLRKG